jgi:hypothetical protein
LSAVVRSVSKKGSQYVILCSGGAPGAEPREFSSAPLGFDPGNAVIGKPVTVYADPTNPNVYYVHVEPLFARSN